MRFVKLFPEEEKDASRDANDQSSDHVCFETPLRVYRFDHDPLQVLNREAQRYEEYVESEEADKQDGQIPEPVAVVMTNKLVKPSCLVSQSSFKAALWLLLLVLSATALTLVRRASVADEASIEDVFVLRHDRVVDGASSLILEADPILECAPPSEVAAALATVLAH